MSRNTLIGVGNIFVTSLGINYPFSIQVVDPLHFIVQGATKYWCSVYSRVLGHQCCIKGLILKPEGHTDLVNYVHKSPSRGVVRGTRCMVTCGYITLPLVSRNTSGVGTIFVASLGINLSLSIEIVDPHHFFVKVQVSMGILRVLGHQNISVLYFV